MTGGKWSLCVEWYPKVTSCSANQQPRLSSLLLSCLWDDVFWLLKTRAAAAAAADAAGAEGPGHARLASGTQRAFVRVTRVFCGVSALMYHDTLLAYWL